MSKPKEYVWIARWGEYMGSLFYYVQNQQRIAARENAPLDAISRQDDGTWSTTDDIVNPVTRKALGLK